MGELAASASPKKKKLPFKPTALRSGAAPKPAPATDGDGDGDDGLDLFRQSKVMEPIMAADRERRLRKKQRQMEERRRCSAAAGGKRPLEEDQRDTPPPTASSAMDEQKEVEDAAFAEAPPLLTEFMAVDGNSFRCGTGYPPPSKRSRLGSQGSRSSRRHIASVDVSENPFDNSPSKRTLRSHTSLGTPSRKPRNEAVTPTGAPLIILDFDSDHSLSPIAETPSKQGGEGNEVVDEPAPAPPAVEEEDDDEFDEYVRKAEAQRARDKAMLSVGSDGAPTKKEAADIVVTSSVPSAHVAHMKYQFDRPLRLVRDSWIALQRRKGAQLPMTQDDDIILTWQKKKVYTYSTLLHLGIRPQGDGRIIIDEYSKGGLANGRTKVHLEAWTTELFQKMELEEELRQKREAGELSDEEAPEEKAQAERVKLRVVLKAREMDEVKLTVCLETTVETLVTGFRTQRGIAPDKDVGIWFDGERLEEHETMETVEVYDMDSFEVHIK